MHEGEEGLHAGEPKRGEKLLGSGSSILSFTSAFASFAHTLSHEDHEDMITIDGGPHTLWWPTQSPDGRYLVKDIPAPQIIREIQPHARFIITLSDPVKRMYSDYYFLNDDLRPVRPGESSGKSAHEFHERSKKQVDLFQTCVRGYMKRLISQMKRFPTSQLNTTKLLQDVQLDLPREYLTYFPLWFRASQM